MSFALGANREGKERVKGKASRIRSSQIGSVLVCVRRNAQLRKLRLLESTPFVLSTVVMIAISPDGPTGCLVYPPPLSPQNTQSHENSPAAGYKPIPPDLPGGLLTGHPGGYYSNYNGCPLLRDSVLPPRGTGCMCVRVCVCVCMN